GQNTGWVRRGGTARNGCRGCGARSRLLFPSGRFISPAKSLLAPGGVGMATVTFQVLEGVDKGRVFRQLPTPVTIGREEGNLLRLNDERVSRFHAKVQQANGDIILTDLESTNGTRVNGNVVQIRRLRVGDRICVGRSLLLFGSNEEIAARMVTVGTKVKPALTSDLSASLAAEGPATVQAGTFSGQVDNDLDFHLNVQDKITATNEALFIGNPPRPPLPQS